MQEVAIRTDTIKLDQFLKWAGVVMTGGEAKNIIQDGLIRVNGEIETRRGKTLQPGDVIEIDGRGSWKVIKG